MNLTHLIQSGGLFLVAAFVFGESALFIGLVLPGDTLLISVGILAAQGKLPLVLSIAVIAFAAILGDNTGYQTGRVMGKRLFHKKDSVIFRQEYVTRAEKFYEKYGNKTMLLSHFIPFVRSFAPMVAGVAKMPWIQLFTYVSIGDIVWAVSITLIGYWFGSRIPNLDHYILPTLVGVVILSFGPTLWHLFGDAETRRRLFAKLRRRHEAD
ncbi:MAG TPA: DedA family protein [Candidatus Saccharimonadales bacterium]|nr:DedA family protein [Candidatus Saccharimonadales bacterium]